MKYVILSVLTFSVAACSSVDYVKIGTRQTEIRVGRDHHDERHERCKVRYREKEKDGRKERERRVDCRSR
jgi:hypothetical protein